MVEMDIVLHFFLESNTCYVFIAITDDPGKSNGFFFLENISFRQIFAENLYNRILK